MMKPQQTIPVTVNNLRCELLYELYINITEEKYLVDCVEDKSDDYLRCIKLLENQECLSQDCLCDNLKLYRRHEPCQETEQTCNIFMLLINSPVCVTSPTIIVN